MGIANITNNILVDSGLVAGSANGLATLDSGGKIPASQLPNSVMEFKGLWDASTNTPTLANGTGNAGDVYEVSAAGTVNFGAGGISFSIGDYVLYDGSQWQFSSGQKGNILGTGTSGQIAYWSGTNTQTGSATLTYSPTGSFLVNNSVTAATAIARGSNLTTTLTAAANNDVLVALDIAPTFTNGAFTGVTNYGIRASGQLRLSSYTTTTSYSGTAAGYLAFDSSGNIITTAAPTASMAIGGSITSATAGSILFAGTSGVLAQDNANLFWDDTNNLLGIGTSSPTNPLTVYSASATYRGINTIQATNDTLAAVFTGQKIRGTGAVQNGDYIFNFNAQGYDGSAYQSGSVIRWYVDGAVSTGVVPTAVEIRTGSSGTGTARLTISSAGVSTFSGQVISTQANSTTTGGGQIYLNGATGNRIDFNTNGVAAPAFTTRSAGTKIVLFPAVSATTVDYAIGIEGSTMWHSITEAISTQFFKWYAGTTNILTLNGVGQMTLSRNQNAITSFTVSNTTSGTASQSYISLTSDASSSNGIIAKTSTGYTAYKILAAKDFYIYNNTTAGDIAILNDFASGTIKFAAGGVSSAQATLTAAGRLLIGTTTESTFLLDVNGTARVSGLITASTGVQYTRLNPTTTTTASTATLTPDISLGDLFTITAQAVALSVANPTGTPVNGQKMTIRIEDNGTARAITWSGTQYRASTDLALPTTTIATKTMYLGFIYNSTDTKWDLIAFINNF